MKLLIHICIPQVPHTVGTSQNLGSIPLTSIALAKKFIRFHLLNKLMNE